MNKNDGAASLVCSNALLAHLRATQQVGPDDWERCSCYLRVTRETTVGEIMDWQNGIRYTSLISLELCKVDDCTPNVPVRRGAPSPQVAGSESCSLCRGTGETDGALGFNGRGPCPRCFPNASGEGSAASADTVRRDVRPGGPQ